MSLTFDGMEQLQRNLALLGARAPEAIEAGVFETAEMIAGTAKERCPVETGTLRASGYAKTEHFLAPGVGSEPDAALLDSGAGVVTAVIGFGGPAIPYALVQHERTDFHHRVGQAKYLETALYDESPHLLERIAIRAERLAEQVGGAG